jgi:predicted RecB family endonuclease
MSLSDSVAEAIRLFKAGEVEKSRQLLHDHLVTELGGIEVLLWLARVAPDPLEATAAAELALALQPQNEIAQRAVAAVKSRGIDTTQPAKADVDVARLTGLTLAQARSVNWPFRGLNRPVGVLLDESVISLRDLGWAVENALDDHIQEAARTILLANLLGDKLQDPRPPLKIVEGASYAEYQVRVASFWMGLIIGVLATIWLAVSLLSIVGSYLMLVHTPGAVYIILAGLGGLLVLFALGYVGTKMVESQAERAEQAKTGGRGEKRVLDVLRASLNGPWAVFHDLEWPNRRWGDVDLVLVGAGGVWALEVKAYERTIRNIGERWEYKGRWGWRKLSRDPGHQAKRNAMNVRDYLDLHGVRVKWVQPVIVWAGDDKTLTVEDPAVPVWRVSEFTERMEDLWREQKLTGDQVEKCTAILSQVIETAAATKAKSEKAMS